LDSKKKGIKVLRKTPSLGAKIPGMSEGLNIFQKTDRVLFKAEERIGKWPVALLTGLFFLLLAGLLTTPRFTPEHHGLGFTRLSQHPFDFSTNEDLRFRILSPLLGYLFFFRGVMFKYLMLIFLVIFYGIIYRAQRKNNLRPSEAVGLIALLAFSTLSFYQLYFPAYNDPLSFILILCCLLFYKNNLLKFLFPALMLFNHENTIFLFPFFWILFLDGDYRISNIFRQTLLLSVSVIPYIFYREWILTKQTVEYDLAYYFDPKNVRWTQEHVFPHLLSGIFQAFKLSWILPVIAIGIDLKEKRFSEIFLLLTCFVFVVSQMLIAYDISRLMGMCFPMIIIAALRIRTHWGSEKFLSLVYILVLVNLFIPSYCIGALEPIPYAPFWMGW